MFLPILHFPLKYNHILRHCAGEYKYETLHCPEKVVRIFHKKLKLLPVTKDDTPPSAGRYITL